MGSSLTFACLLIVPGGVLAFNADQFNFVQLRFTSGIKFYRITIRIATPDCVTLPAPNEPDDYGCASKLFAPSSHTWFYYPPQLQSVPEFSIRYNFSANLTAPFANGGTYVVQVSGCNAVELCTLVESERLRIQAAPPNITSVFVGKRSLVQRQHRMAVQLVLLDAQEDLPVAMQFPYEYHDLTNSVPLYATGSRFGKIQQGTQFGQKS